MKLNALSGVNVAVDLARNQHAVRRDVARHFPGRANGHGDLVTGGRFYVAQHLAVNAHAVQENQTPIDGGGASDKRVKSFLSVCESFVFYFFKHGHVFLKYLKGP